MNVAGFEMPRRKESGLKSNTGQDRKREMRGVEMPKGKEKGLRSHKEEGRGRGQGLKRKGR